MAEVIYLFLHDSSNHPEESDLLVNIPESNILPNIVGLICIDLKGNQELYDRFVNKQINLTQLPIFVVFYGGEIRNYPYTTENYMKIKSKISELIQVNKSLI